MSGFDELNATLPGASARRGASQIPGQSGFDALNANLRKQVSPGVEVQDSPSSEPDFSNTNLQFGPWDTGVHLNPGLAKALAQIGSGMADLPLRGRQLTNTATEKDVDEKKAADAKLNTDALGTAYNMIGGSLPFVLTPEMKVLDKLGLAAPVVKSALTGAAQGAAQPVGTGDSTTRNVVTGGLAGTAGPGVVATGQKIATTTTPLARNLARTAIEKYNMPIGIGDVSQNRTVNALSSFLGQTGLGAGATEAKQNAFNKAAMATFGEHTGAEKLTPDVIAANKARIGKDFDQVWNQNDLQITPQLLNDIDAVRAKAQRYPSGPAADIDAHLADLQTKVAVDPTTGQVALHPQTGLPYIPGDIANNFQSQMWTKNPQTKSSELVNEMRGKLLDNFNAEVTPETAALNNQARGQYRALKTLNPIAVSNENMVAGRLPGDIAPAQLSGAVAKGYPNGNSPFDELPQIGQTLVNKSVPETGGSPKALLQGLGLAGLSGGGGAALGQYLGVGPLLGSLAATGGMTALGIGASSVLKSPSLYRTAAGIAPAATNPSVLSQVVGAVPKLAAKELGRLPSAGALALTEAGVERKKEEEALAAAGLSPDTDTPAPDLGGLEMTTPSPEPTQ